MELKQAQEIAVAICHKLQPFAREGFINIAGSIRRKKPEVKDIEICLVKRYISVKTENLFGAGEPTLAVILGLADFLTSLGTTIKGKVEGRYMQIALNEGINLDLFMPDEADYFRQYVIRTGPSEYAHRVIANGWRKKGWVGSDLGLRLEKDCLETKSPDNKSKWTCVRNKNNEPPTWRSEAEFYTWLGIQWIRPEERN